MEMIKKRETTKRQNQTKKLTKKAKNIFKKVCRDRINGHSKSSKELQMNLVVVY